MLCIHRDHHRFDTLLHSESNGFISILYCMCEQASTILEKRVVIVFSQEIQIKAKWIDKNISYMYMQKKADCNRWICNFFSFIVKHSLWIMLRKMHFDFSINLCSKLHYSNSSRPRLLSESVAKKDPKVANKDRPWKRQMKWNLKRKRKTNKDNKKGEIVIRHVILLFRVEIDDFDHASSV